MNKKFTHTFTYSYAQPSEYHFSLDSIEMPLRVSQFLQTQNLLSESGLNFLSKGKVLDLCAGCGVIGFEFHFHIPDISQMDFVEVQDVYKDYFEINLQLVRVGPRKNSPTQFQFFNMNYDRLLESQFENQYDLVLCNPPYFETDQGKLSPSLFKNRCRFYIDSSFSTLIEVMLNVLKPEGRSFFLLRSLSDHGKNLIQSLDHLITDRAKFQVLDSIRGTSLICLQKNP